MSPQERTQALANAPVSSLLFKLALPSIIAQLVNLLYNLVDRIFIGHIAENGGLALTGLGLCFPIVISVLAFTHLFGTGGAPKAAIALGEKDSEKASKILGSCASSIVIAAIILTVVFEIFAEPILFAFGASQNTIPFAMEYIRVYLAGTIFVVISLGLNPFITTQGAAKISMITILTGAILNTILDPIFIFVLNLGVK